MRARRAGSALRLRSSRRRGWSRHRDARRPPRRRSRRIHVRRVRWRGGSRRRAGAPSLRRRPPSAAAPFPPRRPRPPSRSRPRRGGRAERSRARPGQEDRRSRHPSAGPGEEDRRGRCPSAGPGQEDRRGRCPSARARPRRPTRPRRPRPPPRRVRPRNSPKQRRRRRDPAVRGLGARLRVQHPHHRVDPHGGRRHRPADPLLWMTIWADRTAAPDTVVTRRRDVYLIKDRYEGEGLRARGSVAVIVVPAPGPDVDVRGFRRAARRAPASPPARSPCTRRRRVEPGAVVAHGHDDRFAARRATVDDRAPRAAVLARVVQRLLDDPVDRDLALGIACAVGADEVHVDVDLQPEPPPRAPPARRSAAGQPELVERGRAQLGDQRAQRRDLAVELGDGVAEQLVDRRRVVLGAPGGRQPEAQRGERLQRLVVQLARPAAALLLGRGEALARCSLCGAAARSPPRSRRWPRRTPTAAGRRRRSAGRPRAGRRRAARRRASPRKTSGTARPAVTGSPGGRCRALEARAVRLVLQPLRGQRAQRGLGDRVVHRDALAEQLVGDLARGRGDRPARRRRAARSPAHAPTPARGRARRRAGGSCPGRSARRARARSAPSRPARRPCGSAPRARARSR